MDIIESLEDLIEQLDHSDPSKQGKMIKQMNIPLSDFEAFATWDKDCYTRNCIHRTDEYELILLCWKKGETTQIHGHDGQDCWVYQLKGELTEIRYKKNESGELIERNRMHLLPGNLTFMSNIMDYHKLSNETNNRAMTLHVYVSPISSCQVFNAKKEVFEEKELEYDTINGMAFSEAK
jgi:cysteine dioxygenase